MSVDCFFFWLWIIFFCCFTFLKNLCTLGTWSWLVGYWIFVFLLNIPEPCNTVKWLGSLGDSFILLKLALKKRAAFNWGLIFTHYWRSTLLSTPPMPHVLVSFLIWLVPPHPCLISKGCSTCFFLGVLSPTMGNLYWCI